MVRLLCQNIRFDWRGKISFTSLHVEQRSVFEFVRLIVGGVGAVLILKKKPGRFWLIYCSKVCCLERTSFRQGQLNGCDNRHINISFFSSSKLILIRAPHSHKMGGGWWWTQSHSSSHQSASHSREYRWPYRTGVCIYPDLRVRPFQITLFYHPTPIHILSPPSVLMHVIAARLEHYTSEQTFDPQTVVCLLLILPHHPSTHTHYLHSCV